MSENFAHLLLIRKIMHIYIYTHILRYSLRGYGGAQRYLDISAYGPATQQAPDESSGTDGNQSYTFHSDLLLGILVLRALT
jgi:hypothetical protein